MNWPTAFMVVGTVFGFAAMMWAIAWANSR
jgi:hypothetical protein